MIESPALLCINNKDKLKVIQSSELELVIIYVSPKVINSHFKDYFMPESELSKLSLSETQDHMWLNFFIMKTMILVDILN